MLKSYKDTETIKRLPNKHYRILEIDLTKERTNEEFDLERMVNFYNELKVKLAPSDFSFRLNNKQNDLINIYEDETYTIDNFLFDKIFITNDAAVGCAEIWIASRRD